jgi:hypothetical protein
MEKVWSIQRELLSIFFSGLHLNGGGYLPVGRQRESPQQLALQQYDNQDQEELAIGEDILLCRVPQGQDLHIWRL